MQHIGASLAGRDLRVRGKLRNLREQISRNRLRKIAVQFRGEARIRGTPGRVSLLPGIILCRELFRVRRKIGTRVGAHEEMLAVRQTERLARSIDKLCATFSVGLRRPSDFGDSFPDDRLRDDDLRLASGRLRPFEGTEESHHVVAVDRLDSPLDRLKALRGVFALRGIGHRIERHVVGIVNEDQVIEFEMTGEGDRLHGHALLHAAVSGQRHDVVVDDRLRRGVEFGRRHLLRHRVAHRICHPLPQRPRGGLDARSLVKFRVPWRDAAEHAEFLHLLEIDRIPAQVQPRIQKHRAMSGTEDESVPVQPVRISRLILERVPKEHRADLRTAERQTEMTGRTGVNCFHGKPAGFIGSTGKGVGIQIHRQ